MIFETIMLRFSEHAHARNSPYFELFFLPENKAQAGHTFCLQKPERAPIVNNAETGDR